VNKSIATGGAETPGDFYAEETGCDSADWHSFQTGGLLPRGAILEQAVFAALVLMFPPKAETSKGYPGEQVATFAGLEDVAMQRP
jgi:hypothetical protein